jgi:hypothetical protein
MEMGMVLIELMAQTDERVEQAYVVDDDKKYGEVEIDMIERTRNHPNAIMLGTFHTYKTN